MNTRPLRLAFGRMMQESNSFSTVPTTREDFERTHYLEGPELMQACQQGQWEVEGFLKNLELSGFCKAVRKIGKAEIEAVPLLSAWSISGGPVAADYFSEICERFQTLLREAGPLDGLYLALHGAMGVEGILDPDVVLLKAIREIVGPDLPIVVSFDLHALMTREKIELLNGLCAYHTNPHWDMSRTGFRSGKMLIPLAQKKSKPTLAWRSLPLLLGGGNTLDFWPPMRGIFEYLKDLCSQPGVIDASVFMCHPYLSHPELGWSVVVITENNLELAESLAEDLAERCWKVRHQQPPRFLEVEEALEKVHKARLSRKIGSVAICDASDVVGAGGTGENTHLLKALLAEPDLLSLVPLRDPVAVAKLAELEMGDEVTISVGGRLQPEVNPAIAVTGRLRKMLETKNFGRMAVLDTGSVQLVLTEGYAMPMKPSFYEDLGLSVREADIVVVKNFFHFRLYYATHCLTSLFVKTKGITDFDRILDVPLSGPAWPRDQIDDWRPEDRRRRGLAPDFAPPPPPKLKPSPRQQKRWGLAGILVLVVVGLFWRVLSRTKHN
jgi:microcystin degradation protein MlrC